MRVGLFGLLIGLMLLPVLGRAQSLDQGPKLDTTKDYYALIKTSMGEIPLKLHADKAPESVRNFVNLAEGTREYVDPKTTKPAKSRYYDGLIFHRVVPGRWIQGGDIQGDGKGDIGYTIKDETDDSLDFNKGGVLAMANKGIPNSNASQFFITVDAYPVLNGKHTIFGSVIEGTKGMEIVRKINDVPRGAWDRPREDVKIESVQIYRRPKGGTDADAAAAMGATYEKPK